MTFFNMKLPCKYILVMLGVALGPLGCGSQHGKFITAGDQSQTLSSHVGCVDIVSGYEVSSPGDEKNLLYAIVVCPTIQSMGSDSSEDYGKYVTTLNHSWQTKTGVVAISISWDRTTDSVTIGEKQFMRNKGNLFVAKVINNGAFSVTQLTNESLHAGFRQVLKTAQQQLSQDELISSLKF